MNKQNFPKKSLELIFGIVSPLGADKDSFIYDLVEQLELMCFKTKVISVTNQLFTKSDDKKIPKSLSYYIKMEACSKLRETYSNAILLQGVISKISSNRKKNKNIDTIVYIIDQLKNVTEYKVLQHIYGINYIQISLFSNQSERDKVLKENLTKDQISHNELEKHSYYKNIKNSFSKKNILNKQFTKSTIDKWIDKYIKEISPDASHKLIEKISKILIKIYLIKNLASKFMTCFIDLITLLT